MGLFSKIKAIQQSRGRGGDSRFTKMSSPLSARSRVGRPLSSVLKTSFNNGDIQPGCWENHHLSASPVSHFGLFFFFFPITSRLHFRRGVYTLKHTLLHYGEEARGILPTRLPRAADCTPKQSTVHMIEAAMLSEHGSVHLRGPHLIGKKDVKSIFPEEEKNYNNFTREFCQGKCQLRST